jgi:hypothetical protein
MKPAFLFASLLLLASSALPREPEAMPVQRAALKLGPVSEAARLDGCGCSVYRTDDDLRNDRFLFMSDMDREAVIHLNGQDTKLRVLSWKEKQGQLKVGARSRETYAAGDLTVRLDFTVRRVCPPKDESCEATWYDVKLAVTRNRRRTVVHAKGICGC